MGKDVLGLAILGVCVVLFLTKRLPVSVTGCLGCLLMVLGRVCTFEQAFSGFSNSIVLLMASVMIVGIAMFSTGAAQIIGRTAISLSHGDEKRFLMASCVLSGLLSMFLANTALVAVFIPIIDSVCRSEGASGGTLPRIKKEPNMKRKNLLLPITCSIMLGGSATLVGCTPQLTANAILSRMSGVEMTMWTLTGPGLCLLAVFLVYLHFMGYRLGMGIWGTREERQMTQDEAKIASVMRKDFDRRKLAVMSAILAFMLASYVFKLLPVAETALASALLCLITGCCGMADIRREMHWETVILLASCLGLAETLTVSGAGDLIGRGVSASLGEVRSPWAVFAVIVALTLILSQFITNSTAIIIALPIGLSLCGVYGFNPLPFCVGVTLAASIACCTPLAAAQITMTQVAGYEFSDYFKYCGLPSLILYLCIIALVPVFYPLAG